MNTPHKTSPAVFALLMLFALPAAAQEEPALNSGNTAWMLTATALVLLMMLPALALFYGGLVRAKNLLSVLMHCLLMAGVASLLWTVALYSLALKGDGGGIGSLGGWIGDLSAVGLKGITPESMAGDIPETVVVMFQMTFAIITPGLVVGAFVERVKLGAVVWFTILWSILVYAPAAHWVWGNGWMMQDGVIDLAGGIVVHATAGVSALVFAAMLGRRRGFPKQILPPHSPWMVVTGAALLWVGWFGFNAGSQVAANGSAGMTMLVTHLAAATGTLTWALVEKIKTGKAGVVGAATGTIAGLATVTPASGVVGPMGAIILGALAGLVCYLACALIKERFKIDDSLDVFAVHGLGGIMGTVLLAVLGTPAFGGLGEFDMVEQMGIQLKCVAVTVVWSVVATFVIVKVIALFGGLRVSEEDEETGLDDSSHGEKAYHL